MTEQRPDMDKPRSLNKRIAGASMAAVPDGYTDLLERALCAHIATTRPDGTVQVFTEMAHTARVRMFVCERGKIRSCRVGCPAARAR
jgi:hypothetical protein